MYFADWLVLGAYFVVMIGIGWWAKSRVKNAADFFTAGGKMPWWLAGISHHMSGYSAAVFVAYAAIAYTTGFALYVWWALTITIACLVGAVFFAPRWPRLRQRLGIISPLEYLATRYNLPAQQVLAWSGAALKVFDVAAKWAASAILLNVFAGVPIAVGILIVGGVTLIYSTIGGLWADALTDMGQFIIQSVAGIAMLIFAVAKLGGVSSIAGIWSRLPASHSQPFAGDYTIGFFLAYCLISTISYNGGTWNLAQRFIAAPSGSAARKSVLLSGALYLVWPLVLFFPMWAAPLILPNLTHPDQAYALLTQQLLPAGLVGLVVAGMFSHTMAMTSSDANAISAVVIRDIIPALRGSRQPLTSRAELLGGRISTFLFIGLSMVIALSADSFGGVLGLIILWFGALVGPIAVPMLLGMLRPFRRCGPSAALFSWATGLIVFALAKYAFAAPIASLGTASAQTINVAAPVLASAIVYCVFGWLRPWRNEASDALVESLDRDLEPAAALPVESAVA
ncbi:sodium:solute symporter family protein [Arthrobacter sp. FW306-2-2C-D06B]|uniref:sodium:solute symporter family protein n=1 Tax=Arthrobacter sp. FW306-2-2C-D06B TaxID=2879618 RepID=UPI001F1B8616|nr:sodium:solute symporter family protein [Arthrobacter sp. FW306-2-2C-D06B]UKA59336.1 Na+:solute symporter [Arthrobacter sp. FW306-2-2C-D06B]